MCSLRPLLNGRSKTNQVTGSVTLPSGCIYCMRLYSFYTVSRGAFALEFARHDARKKCPVVVVVVGGGGGGGEGGGGTAAAAAVVLVYCYH